MINQRRVTRLPDTSVLHRDQRHYGHARRRFDWNAFKVGLQSRPGARVGPAISARLHRGYPISRFGSFCVAINQQPLVGSFTAKRRKIRTTPDGLRNPAPVRPCSSTMSLHPEPQTRPPLPSSGRNLVEKNGSKIRVNQHPWECPRRNPRDRQLTSLGSSRHANRSRALREPELSSVPPSPIAWRRGISSSSKPLICAAGEINASSARSSSTNLYFAFHCIRPTVSLRGDKVRSLLASHVPAAPDLVVYLSPPVRPASRFLSTPFTTGAS